MKSLLNLFRIATFSIILFHILVLITYNFGKLSGITFGILLITILVHFSLELYVSVKEF